MTDFEYKQLENKIEFLLKSAPEPMHAFDHAKRVSDYAVKIVGILKLHSEVDINLLRAAGLMHDVPKALTKPTFINSVVYHFFESWLIQKKLPGILQDLEIDSASAKIIYTAAVKHPLSYPFHRLNKKGSVYTRIVQDADTIDFFSPQRMELYNKFKNKFAFYRMINVLSWLNRNVGFKNISFFLNFPQLSDNLKDFY